MVTPMGITASTMTRTSITTITSRSKAAAMSEVPSSTTTTTTDPTSMVITMAKEAIGSQRPRKSSLPSPRSLRDRERFSSRHPSVV